MYNIQFQGGGESVFPFTLEWLSFTCTIALAFPPHHAQFQIHVCLDGVMWAFVTGNENES